MPTPRPSKGRRKKAPGRRPVAQTPAVGGASTEALPLRCIGIDLGLANTAAAVIDGLGDPQVMALEYLRTDPDHAQRQMADDWRRLRLILYWVRGLLAKWRHPTGLTVVRFEWFAPRFNVKRGWTTSMVVGLVGAAAVVEALRPENNAGDFGPLEALPAQPPLHVQVALVPLGWKVAAQARPHVLDALTHARLEWLRRKDQRQ
jgi:hypothetical protein